MQLENPTKNSCCHSWRSPWVLLVLLGMLLISGIVVVSILRDRIVNQPQWQVTVMGQGKVSYQPDIATILLAVQIDKASSAEVALNQLSSRIDKVIAAVKNLNIPPEDIQTQSYVIYTQYDYIENVSTVAGYNASQQLAVKVRNLDQAGDLVTEVISKATAAGANRVDGVNFEVSNIEVLKQQARVQAINEAKGKASALAEAAGLRLKRVVGWWDNVIQAPGTTQAYYLDGKGGAGGSVGTAPSGLQEVIIEVSLNYLVK